MRTTILHLAPVALAITIGCDGNPGVPAAPGGAPAGVVVAKNPPRPRKSGWKERGARPVGPLSPRVFFD